MSASAAPVLFPTPVALWRAGIEEISQDVSPCRHLIGARWTTMRESCLDFLDRFGAEAYRLGWTASELFAVHPEHGTMRPDYCGALMISGYRVHGIDADAVRFEQGVARRDQPGQQFGVPVWAFGKGGRPALNLWPRS